MLYTSFELWKLQSFFWNKERSQCVSVYKSCIISNMHSGNLYWAPTTCLGNRALNRINKVPTSWSFQSTSDSSGQVWSSSHFLSHSLLRDTPYRDRHFYSFHLSSSIHKIMSLLTMNFVLLCLSEKFNCTDGPTVSLSFQLQQFCSNMLEEHQRLTVQAKLQTIKNENLKNKERSARIAAWLQKNT